MEASPLVQLLDGLTVLFKQTVSYLQDNAWYILIMLGIGYVAKTKFLDPLVLNARFAPQGKREANFQDDIRRVRLEQQEKAHQRAIEAAKERKIKEAQEKERKNKAAAPAPKKGGRRLGGNAPDTSSYNPMMPSGGTGGGGYKPTRRTARRG